MCNLNKESVNTILERLGLFSIIFKPFIDLLKERLFLISFIKILFIQRKVCLK